MMRLLILGFVLMTLSAPTMAQTATAPSPAAAPTSVNPADAAIPGEPSPKAVMEEESSLGPPTEIEQEITDQIDFMRPLVDPSKMRSLFFTIWEHDLIRDARRGLTTRGDLTDDGVPRVTSTREIALGGIVYHSSTKWVVWLNNIRVSPTRIPNEVMDLKVYKDYIELEWFDSQTNQIFPIRMRPHQRFNLDARIFLPG